MFIFASARLVAYVVRVDASIIREPGGVLAFHFRRYSNSGKVSRTS